MDIDVFTPNLAGENFGALLAVAGTVFQSNSPAMPTANDLAELDNAFAQGKAEVGAQIFNGVDLIFPAKQRNL